MLSLTDAETTNTVVKATVNFFLYGKAPESMEGTAAQIWEKLKQDIERGRTNYAETCERNRTNISKRYQSNTNGIPLVNQSNTGGIPTNNKKHVTSISEQKEDIFVSEPRRARFVPPSEEEVATYFIEQGSTAKEASAFWDYYQSNGWRTGKNPMRDWKASARNWIRRAKQYQPKPHAAPTTGNRGAWGTLCDGSEPQAEQVPIDELFPD